MTFKIANLLVRLQYINKRNSMKHLIILIVIFQGLLYSDGEVASKDPAMQENKKESKDGIKEGREDALKDIERGVYRLELYGFSGSTYKKYYYFILRKKYNIHADMVAGCRVNKYIRDHAKEYNRVMTMEIKKKFGDEVFKNADKEGRKIYLYKRDKAVN